MAGQQEEWVRHLGELRRRLIVVSICFTAAMGFGLYMSPRILAWVKAQPAALHLEWNVFSLTDGLFVYMRCAFGVAFVLTLPVLLIHIWAFVKPGLTKEESKGTLKYVPAATGLFVTGAAFGYWVVLPAMIRFMSSLNQRLGVSETYGIDKYFDFLFRVVFPLGIAFEMPVVVLFLTRLGVLTPERLRSGRKGAYLLLAIVGASITPPDFVSHLSVTVPLILLFEASVLLSTRFARRQHTAAPAGT